LLQLFPAHPVHLTTVAFECFLTCQTDGDSDTNWTGNHSEVGDDLRACVPRLTGSHVLFGGIVDKRYYLSLLLLAAFSVVAWVMSKLPDPRGFGGNDADITDLREQDATVLARLADVNRTQVPERVDGNDVAGLSSRHEYRRGATQTGVAAGPIIPGLLDRDSGPRSWADLNELNHASASLNAPRSLSASDGRGEPVETVSPVQPGTSTHAPLHAVGGATSSPRGDHRPEIGDRFDDDQVSPRMRKLPSFSMPNTQQPAATNDQIVSGGEQDRRSGDLVDPQTFRPGGEFQMVSPSQLSSQTGPLGSSLPPPDSSPPVGRAAIDMLGNGMSRNPLDTIGSTVSPNSGILRPAASSTALEGGLSPGRLPGNHQILRPIMRGKPRLAEGNSTVDDAGPQGTTSESLTNSSEPRQTVGGPSNPWDAPMPGVKRPSSVTTRTASQPPIGGRVESPPRFPNPTMSPTMSASPAAGPVLPIEPSSDPLFALAAQDLYRLPAREASTPSEWTSGQATSLPTGRGDSVGAGGAQSISSAGANARSRLGSGRTGSNRPDRDYIWHVIQRNQSLEDISRQYMGSSGGVNEIVEMNPDIISNPRLLPVGQAIRIPLR
jgi:hypothetical protein